MTDKNNLCGEVALNDGSTALSIISWLFALLFFVIGVVNTFWGNDPFFGVFILLLSLIYFLLVTALFQKITGDTTPKMWLVKILLGLFILWVAMGVGGLFDKIELMMYNL